MGIDDFHRRRKPAWDRLTEILDAIHQRGVRSVPPADIEELVHLYRQVSADLARLRAQQADPMLIDELNRLVVRAHGRVYRGLSKRSLRIAAFLLHDHPRLFRATWRCTLASFICAASFAVMSYHAVQSRPELVADIMRGMDEEFYYERTESDIRDRFQVAASPVISSMVTTNNIRVALYAFALGITFGVGTVYVLIVNGTMVGGLAGAYARSGVGSEFWLTILPHGALELSAIVVAGGAGLLLGAALWAPGQRTRGRAIREEALRACKLAVGLIPAFIVAGFFEGFVTPSDLPDAVKVSLGATAALAFWLHLLISGRTPRPHQE